MRPGSPHARPAAPGLAMRCAAAWALAVGAWACGASAQGTASPAGAAPAAPAAAAGAAERAVRKSVDVRATPEQVWEAWTTREGVVSFLAPDAVVDARPGGAFHIHFMPDAPPGLKGADDMRFMALQKPAMLSFDWNAPPSLPAVRAQRTFVVVRLSPLAEGGTRVTLHQSGWGDGGEWDRAYAYFDRAWGSVLANLQRRFESGPLRWAVAR